MPKTHPLYLAGSFCTTNQTIDVINPYDNSHIATVAQAGPDEIEQATAAAVESFHETKQLEPYQRREILEHITHRIQERSEEFARSLTLENGKTINESRGEVQRCIATFQSAIGECERIYGDHLDCGVTARGAGRRFVTRKFPIGPVAAISPFNFPLNLSAHKIAPAIATGCPIVLKPASKTPLTCLLLSEIIDETIWPKGAFSCLPCSRKAGQALVEDDRYKLLSFTGSPGVGWQMKRDAGKKQVVLELGGNAAAIIDRDIDDWQYAIDRTVLGSFYQAGQVCISVQHIYCHRAVYDTFVEKFIEKVRSLRIGDPLDESTDIGPMIDAKNLERITAWTQEAIDAGATLLTGHTVKQNAIAPTVLEGTPSHVEASCEEAFGPLVNLHRVDSIEEAVARANDTKFGLQVGVFSHHFPSIQYVFNTMDVGGVIVNDIPSYRVDHMPYGGLKESGLGREGVKYAMRDMLEERVMVYFS